MNNIVTSFVAIIFWNYLATTFGSDKKYDDPNNENRSSNQILAPSRPINLDENTKPEKKIPLNEILENISKQILPEKSVFEISHKKGSTDETKVTNFKTTIKKLSPKLSNLLAKQSKIQATDNQEIPSNKPNSGEMKQINLNSKNIVGSPKLPKRPRPASTSPNTEEPKKNLEKSSKNSDPLGRVAELINTIQSCENLRTPAFEIPNEKVDKKISDIIDEYEISEETKRIYELSSNADISIIYGQGGLIMEAHLRGICKQLGNMLSVDEKYTTADFLYHGIKKEVTIGKKVDEKRRWNIGSCTFKNIKFYILLGHREEDRTYFLLSIPIDYLKILEHFYTRPSEDNNSIRVFKNYSELPDIMDEWLGKSKQSSSKYYPTYYTESLFEYLLAAQLMRSLDAAQLIPNDEKKNSEILKEICRHICAPEEESGNQLVYEGFEYSGHSNVEHTVGLYKLDLFKLKLKPYGVCNYEHSKPHIHVYLAQRNDVIESYLLAVEIGRKKTEVIDSVQIAISKQVLYF